MGASGLHNVQESETAMKTAYLCLRGVKPKGLLNIIVLTNDLNSASVTAAFNTCKFICIALSSDMFMFCTGESSPSLLEKIQSHRKRHRVSPACLTLSQTIGLGV